MEQTCEYVGNQRMNDSNGIANPSGGENCMHSVEMFLKFLSLQASCESVDMASAKGNRL